MVEVIISCSPILFITMSKSHWYSIFISVPVIDITDKCEHILWKLDSLFIYPLSFNSHQSDYFCLQCKTPICTFISPSFSDTTLCHCPRHSALPTLTTSFAWTESKSTMCDTLTQMYLCRTPTDAAAAAAAAESRCRERKKSSSFIPLSCTFCLTADEAVGFSNAVVEKNAFIHMLILAISGIWCTDVYVCVCVWPGGRQLLHLWGPKTKIPLYLSPRCWTPHV